MSVDLIDPYNFDEYFNALISPVSDNTKRQEINSSIQEKQKLMENEKKFNLIQKVEPQNLPSQMHHQNLLMPNMIPNGVIAIVPLNINHNMLTNTINNNNVTAGNVVQPINNTPTSNTKKTTTKKRKNLAETSKNVVTTITEVTSKSIDGEADELGKLQEETEQPPQSPNKKTKKNGKAPKKKKETPKRKRVNYCFEIHRSGCQANKDSKLYCKVFLKGKLQSEVDLIKGARGKWAYTFYDQRKKKKERRYWPSQSSGPVIEDPCNCDKCAPNGIQIVPTNNTNMMANNSHHEEEYSSPSTEEDEGNQNNINNNPNAPQLSQHQMQQMQILRQQQSEYQTIGFPQYDSQATPQVVYYMPHNVVYPYPNEVLTQQQQESIYQQQQYALKMEQQKNFVNLKSSNDFQDRNHHLKSSNDFMVNNHQRPWENYFNGSLGTSLGSSMGSSNNMEYNSDGFFVDNLQNNFL